MATQKKFVVKNGLIASDLSYPTSDGTANQSLLTDGTGNLSFGTLSTSTVTEGSNLYYTDARADARVALIVDAAPSTLDTLNELAAALGDDANFSTTVTNSIANKLPLAGGTITGDVSFTNGNKAVFGGTGNGELEIYAHATNNNVYISENGGSGNLNLGADNFNIYTNAFTKQVASFTAGSAKLLNDGNEKLATTSTGIEVTGNITVSGYIAGPAVLTIDPAGVGDNTGKVVIAGDLQIDGTTTTINSTTLTVDDLNITLASGAADSAAANGAGITVDGANATITYDGTNDEWDFNKDVNVTGNIALSGTVDGVDIAARDGVLTSTTTTANAALPKAGGTVTGQVDFQGELIVGNPASVGHMQMGNISNDSGNGFIRSSILMQRDQDQISYDASTDTWNHAGGSSTDWSMIAHSSGSFGIWSGPSVTSSTDYTNATWNTNFKWLSVNHATGGASRTITFTASNIAVTGTVDGRDVAADGTKLDTIETNATADQTAAQLLTAIKTVDGTGSGLDADTVDGIQASSFLRSDAADTMTGNLTLSGQLIGGVGAVTTSGTADWNHSTNARSGNGHTLLLGSATNGPSGGSYYHPFSFEYNTKGGTGNMTQFAIPYNNAEGVYFRSRYSSVWTGWNEMWHSGNDGTGSGLDADLLDGVQGSSFLRSDATDTFTTLSGTSLTTTNLTVGSSAKINFQNNDSISFNDGDGVGAFSFNADAGTANALLKAGAATFSSVTVSGTVDGVDIAARNGVLTSTTTTANAALPKAGGTVTGVLYATSRINTGEVLSLIHI